MEILYSLSFYAIAGILILAALSIIATKHIVHAAVALVVTFLSVAGIFVMLNADFLAIAQILIYAVGLVIVLIFAIMLTGEDANKKLWIAIAPRTLIAPVIAFLLFIMITFSITNGFSAMSEKTKIFRIQKTSQRIEKIYKTEGTSRKIGNSLFTTYVLPFEILSLLLLAVLIGTAVIARKPEDKLVNPTTVTGDDS